MNLPTIGIIFALFFCSAWAGICMSGTRIAAQSNSSPPHRPKFNSARFNEEKIKDAIAHCKKGTNSNRENADPRRTASANSATTTNLLWDSAGGSISDGDRNKNRGNNKDFFANASQHQLRRTTSSSSTRNRRKKVQFKDTAGTSGRGGTNDSYDDDMRKIVALARAREAKRLAEEDVMDKLWEVEPSMDMLWAPAALRDQAEPIRPEAAGQNNKGKSRSRSGNPSKMNTKKNGHKTNREAAAAAAAAPARARALRGENSRQKAEWPQNYQTVRRRNRTRK